MKKTLLFFLITFLFLKTYAADTTKVNPRPLTMAEYDKAKTFTIKDLDKDTYAKVENTYILDRYELRKPYFITGDDGLKKRIDLYKLVAKDGMHELGTLIYYTNEKGKLYTALQPNFTADGKVWEKYFEDIHAIDKEEKNFVLKLSYVLSKEMSFQLFKAINKGKDMRSESSTYGSDICFPGDQEVAMFDGSAKPLSEIKAGDQVITIDPVTQKQTAVTVKQLVQHEAKNYAITKLLLISATPYLINDKQDVQLSSKVLQATPNHPMLTINGHKKMSEVLIGDEVLCFDEKAKSCKTFTVINRTETAGGVQKVYNIEVNGGSTFIMNDVMVLQK
ncbi:MAG: Hint domain-containing protein [Chitinophagaceae bacterium]|nr:Hint domain-containing protein [Chitinophagaceae bacterium]